LGGDHEDVVILLILTDFGEQLAIPGLLDLVKNLLHCFGVGRGDCRPSRDGEPPFSTTWRVAPGDLLVGRSNLREDPAQNVNLLLDRLGSCAAGGVAVV